MVVCECTSLFHALCVCVCGRGGGGGGGRGGVRGRGEWKGVTVPTYPALIWRLNTNKTNGQIDSISVTEKGMRLIYKLNVFTKVINTQFS